MPWHPGRSPPSCSVTATRTVRRKHSGSLTASRSSALARRKTWRVPRCFSCHRTTVLSRGRSSMSVAAPRWVSRRFDFSARWGFFALWGLFKDDTMSQITSLHSAFRRRFSLGTLAAAAAFGSALLATGPVSAQVAFPSKPITIIVPFSPGGTTDILARIVGQALNAELGQSVIIDNRAGAGGNIGGQLAARAPADGYTLFMGTVGTHAINASLYKKMPFDPIKDFAPLTRVANVPNLLVTNPTKPYKNVAELIAYAKANPGKVNFGSSGNGSSIHLSGELFKTMANVEITHVPYKGSAPAVTDLLGGQIDIM